MVREQTDKWTEVSGMMGEIQGGFRRGRRTETKLFMLERLIEMVKGKKEEIFVAFLDTEKAYDQMNRKMFDVMRWYGVHEKLVRLIERIYNGSMMKFELEKVTTGWCKTDSGVRQGCPLSPLLFNIYVRELGKVISKCVHGVKVEEYKYLGITIEGGKQGGFTSMGDRMKEANGLMGIVKYAAEQSGRKYVIGMEGWKTIIVSRLMYGCGALAWYQCEWDNLEVI